MARSVQLLLTETVDNLGIVGDVVNVRTGYARNFLLPNNLATTPTEEKVAALAAKRAEAERHQRELRSQRESLIEKLEGVEVTLVRSCNDQGQLYGSITQQDIATALGEAGYSVKPREVRISQTIKRVDTYHINVKVASDLEADVTLHVKPDRDLDAGRGRSGDAPAGEEGAAPQQRQHRERGPALPDALDFDDDDGKSKKRRSRRA
ncbi:MAG: 50S ribosomal protein L9 [Phycisphaerales bacterium]|nr:50S ribosomal protein L9 [Phycisphaerales bacterium]